MNLHLIALQSAVKSEELSQHKIFSIVYFSLPVHINPGELVSLAPDPVYPEMQPHEAAKPELWILAVYIIDSHFSYQV